MILHADRRADRDSTTTKSPADVSHSRSKAVTEVEITLQAELCANRHAKTPYRWIQPVSTLYSLNCIVFHLGDRAVCKSGAYAAGATLGQPASCSSCPNGHVCEGQVCCPTKGALFFRRNSSLHLLNPRRL